MVKEGTQYGRVLTALDNWALDCRSRGKKLNVQYWKNPFIARSIVSQLQRGLHCGRGCTLDPHEVGGDALIW